MLLGVDVGGTFTDAVLLAGGELHTAKLPTDASDQSAGVLAAVREVLERAGAEPADVEVFAHGMTVGTNALLEERGARTALVTTRGFADLIEIGRQDRPHLYRLCEPKPRPLVDPELRFEVTERAGPEGIVESLDDDALAGLAERVASSGAESVAVCFLFSYLHPEHEARVAALLRKELSDVHISASHEVLPQFREYERFSTTVIDAYLSPLLAAYISRLADGAESAGLPAPLIMKSSGGVAPADEAARAGAWSILSGPAGGAVGAGLLARVSGDRDVVGFDMGGTSCDVCVVEDGSVRLTGSRKVGGRPIQLPMVDVHTVGAGGGSIGWRDSGGALRVGPQSAGSAPGPACYGRGGTEPTVTDANLLLGYLGAESTLAGGVALDVEAAKRAVAGLAEQLGLSADETAEGIVRVANAEMSRALRVVTVERGVDPRSFALMPFGGAGPMHAAAIAEDLGMTRLLCPRAGGVLSALGLCASERRRDTTKTVLLDLAHASAEEVAAELAALREALGDGGEGAEERVVCELRYRGQAFELPVDGGDLEPDGLAERFGAAHEERFGFRDPDAGIELVNLRLTLAQPAAEPQPRAAEDARDLAESVRAARFSGETLEARVIRGEPPQGLSAEGPAIFELPETTLVLPPGWRADVDEAGTIAAERAD